MRKRGKDHTVSRKRINCNIVVLNQDGENNSEIARLLGLSKFTLCQFIKIFKPGKFRGRENLDGNRSHLTELADSC